MVGPSSSHTAGAVKLGRVARKVGGKGVRQVDFYLHGSFAETYEGHGTGKALLGGMLGMHTADERIRDSYRYALEQGLEYNFYPTDLGNVHPNTVKIVMHSGEGRIDQVVGSSIGGGEIKIHSINNARVEFSGQYPTIITRQEDKPGVIARVTSLLSSHGINIAFLRVFRPSKGSIASMVIETDQNVDQVVIDDIKQVTEVNECMFINVSE